MSGIRKRVLKRKRTDTTVDDMDSSSNPEPFMGNQPPTRRQFNELHPKDQSVKLNRKARIESNWGEEIQECIPALIRPRVELKKGAKARVGDVNVQEEVWWNWSVELLRGLEELSTLTAGNPKFAKELLTLEVSQRQAKPKNPQRKLVELLLGDVQRVNDSLRRSQASQMLQNSDPAEEYDTKKAIMGLGGELESANDGGDDYSETESIAPSMEGDTKDTNTSSTQGTPVKVQSKDIRLKAPMAPSMISPSVEAPDRSHYMTVQHLAAGLQQLQARARRLRAQANQLEGEATDLDEAVEQMKAQLTRL